MHDNVMTPMSLNVAFTKIDFAIQNGLPAQLVVRLSYIKKKCKSSCSIFVKMLFHKKEVGLL